MKVIKRDGTTVDFDGNKIVTAIQKANAVVAETERIGEDVIQTIVSDIQNCHKKPLQQAVDKP